MITKELIRQEIEKRVKELDEQIVDIYDSKAVLRKDELQRLLSFIDTLEEPVSDNLKEAAEEYAWRKEQPLSDGERLSSYFNSHIDAFKAGAKWQRKRDQETIETAEDHAFLAGANWQKEQMMKDAVEGEVCILPGRAAYVEEKDNESLKQYLLDHFKYGDKVKIIIVKEEEQ